MANCRKIHNHTTSRILARSWVGGATPEQVEHVHNISRLVQQFFTPRFVIEIPYLIGFWISVPADPGGSPSDPLAKFQLVLQTGVTTELEFRNSRDGFLLLSLDDQVRREGTNGSSQIRLGGRRDEKKIKINKSTASIFHIEFADIYRFKSKNSPRLRTFTPPTMIN